MDESLALAMAAQAGMLAVDAGCTHPPVGAGSTALIGRRWSDVGRCVAEPSGGELLVAALRQRAEAAFGCLVNETYSASEATPLALPCRYGRLHLNSDWFLVAPIDADGAPVPAGVRSDSVLLTKLANQVQPVIRYELGDSVGHVRRAAANSGTCCDQYRRRVSTTS